MTALAVLAAALAGGVWIGVSYAEKSAQIDAHIERFFRDR
jgi:hypothetical protein